MTYDGNAVLQLFTVQAPTFDEAVRKARVKYGDNIKVIQQREIRYGGFMGLFKSEGVEITFYPAIRSPVRQPPRDIEEEKKRFLALAPPRQDETLKEVKEVLKEVQSIKEKISAAASASPQMDAHSSIARLRAMLDENDFSPAYMEKITERLKKEFSLEELEDFEAVENTVVDWIGESVRVYDTEKLRKFQTLILVGPTGVGKTTTIAKLAAMYGVVANDPLNVRIMTIDNYRIGAWEQIKNYGEAMHIPVACVNDAQDFKKCMSLYKDVDMILIDTIGKSPRDFVDLAGMRELLDPALKKASCHLALSATTKTKDLTDIMRQYEPFAYESLVITKLDETPRVGSIISAAAEGGKALSFIADGQRVPENIHAASVPRLLLRLTGFRIRRDHIEEKFGTKGA